MKKKWTKEEFIKKCHEMRAAQTAQMLAAARCKKGARRFKAIEQKKQAKKRRPRDA